MEMAARVISTRRGAFLLSALAAVLAGAMILVYVERYRASVQSGGAPVTVLVASQTIAKGTAGSVIATRQLYTSSTIRESRLLDGAFSDPSSLAGKVATKDIYAGSQLTASDFAPASSNLTASLAPDERVVSLPLDAAHGLIGQLQVGDHVDVYAGFNVIPLDARGIPIAGGQARPVLRLVVPDVPVVAMSGKSGGLAAASGGTTDVDLKVTVSQAANLAFASDNGKIWLSLRPSSGATSSAPQLVTMETLLLGVPPVSVLHSFGGQR
jgi:Flp pilus assembly protein CpaB